MLMYWTSNGLIASTKTVTKKSWYTITRYAPVTKTLLIVTTTTSLAVTNLFPQLIQNLNLDLSAIVSKLELWRLFTSATIYSRPIDIIYGTILLYNFRLFERRYGTAKFLSYLIAVFGLSSLFQLILLMLFKHQQTIMDFPTGPYCWIYGLLVCYYREIPKLSSSTFSLSDKSLLYLLSLQFLSQSRGSIFVGLSGMLAGIIARFKLNWFHQILRFPDSVYRFCHTYLGRILYSSAPLADSPENPMGATVEIQRSQYLDEVEAQITRAQIRQFGMLDDNQQQRNRVGQGYQEVLLPPEEGPFRRRFRTNRDDNPIRPSEPQFHEQPSIHEAENIPRPDDISEDNVKTLVEMGFSRYAVMQALQVTNNDVGLATNILLAE
ncbi:Ubiquitin-associated domain-containing protein 2 [Trichoplax sp. H2]|nr:Ubiquitin-associated domain-containing protein 2 [Trichoplax sp. H2]|eukprot:RDD46050.1 Ubiquitin-associated domain-containing protein 2 [Trichoplax sp. H2]